MKLSIEIEPIFSGVLDVIWTLHKMLPDDDHWWGRRFSIFFVYKSTYNIKILAPGLKHSSNKLVGFNVGIRIFRLLHFWGPLNASYATWAIWMSVVRKVFRQKPVSFCDTPQVILHHPHTHCASIVAHYLLLDFSLGLWATCFTKIVADCSESGSNRAAKVWFNCLQIGEVCIVRDIEASWKVGLLSLHRCKFQSISNHDVQDALPACLQAL